MLSPYLLPGKFRIPGSLFTVIGTVILIVRYYGGIAPDWLEVKVFAVYSAYLDVKHFSIIKNQVLEEIGGLFLFSGLYMLAFSKEKIETVTTNNLRLKAFMVTMWLNAVFILVSIVFTYGLGYVFMMMLDSVFFLVAYIVLFRVLVYKNNLKANTENV
ncbi:MAG: hypothetical protein JST82_07200 [Bacteroidetes bacterium]|nr:hypothetical protein [Bacteroidota bacterium]